MFVPTGENNPKTGKAVVVPLDTRRHAIYYLDADGKPVKCVEGFYISHFATCTDPNRFSKAKST